MLIYILNEHVPFKVCNLLEAACGSGRFLTNFPKYGYKITGYDVSHVMVEYARDKINKLGLEGRAEVVFGDMKTAVFAEKFDSAFNSINSLGYLLSDDEIVSHFNNTADSIKEDGVYIIHIGCTKEKSDFTPDSMQWTCEKNGITVNTTWGIENIDFQKKLNYEYCILDINDNGKQFKIEDKHVLRMWLYSDIKRLIEESKKFTLIAIYDEGQNSLALDSEVGDLGNLYFVLCVR